MKSYFLDDTKIMQFPWNISYDRQTWHLLKIKRAISCQVNNEHEVRALID